MEREESDQLPEEQPPEGVPEDDDTAARGEAQEQAGVPGAEGANTGNPGAAGEES